jgi:hypothetical protein
LLKFLRESFILDNGLSYFEYELDEPGLIVRHNELSVQFLVNLLEHFWLFKSYVFTAYRPEALQDLGEKQLAYRLVV